MANEEHLAILRRGVEDWNTWRKENADIHPDLSRADLSGTNLGGANLSGTNLRWIDLRLASLSGADLKDVDLFRADLHGAVLSELYLNGANLTGADLSTADLSGANLRGANLSAVNLREAKLAGTDFTKAIISHTIFSDNDLSVAKNLEFAHYAGPSTIGVDTLYKSNGNVPPEFLEGCGVPEAIITFAKSLVGTAIEYYSCFISHSSRDDEFVNQTVYHMRKNGLRVWNDAEDIKGGRKIHEQLYEAIRFHDKFIIVLSEASMNSKWVETEIRRARKRERDEKRRILFPVRLVSYDTLKNWELFDADEGRDLAQEIREYYIPDFSHWKDYDKFTKEFEKLLRDLRASEWS